MADMNIEAIVRQHDAEINSIRAMLHQIAVIQLRQTEHMEIITIAQARTDQNLAEATDNLNGVIGTLGAIIRERGQK